MEGEVEKQKRYLVISLFGYYEELPVVHLTP